MRKTVQCHMASVRVHIPVQCHMASVHVHIPVKAIPLVSNHWYKCSEVHTRTLGTALNRSLSLQKKLIHQVHYSIGGHSKAGEKD